jgi:hypothetical protein
MVLKESPWAYTKISSFNIFCKNVLKKNRGLLGMLSIINLFIENHKDLSSCMLFSDFLIHPSTVKHFLEV